MGMTLGRRGDYAVRAALDLARHWDGGPRKTREIAIAMDIPSGFLQQILADLVAEGLLQATAGPKGGYRLARPPEEITLLDIVERAEGDVALDRCILRGGSCDWIEVCPVHDTWSRAQHAFSAELRATTLADLARIDRDIEQGRYVPSQPTHVQPTTRRGNRS